MYRIASTNRSNEFLICICDIKNISAVNLQNSSYVQIVYTSLWPISTRDNSLSTDLFHGWQSLSENNFDVVNSVSWRIDFINVTLFRKVLVCLSEHGGELIQVDYLQHTMSLWSFAKAANITVDLHNSFHYYCEIPK